MMQTIERKRPDLQSGVKAFYSSVGPLDREAFGKILIILDRFTKGLHLIGALEPSFAPIVKECLSGTGDHARTLHKGPLPQQE